MTTTIKVEIAYAKEDMQLIDYINIFMGATVGQAILASRIPTLFPEVDLTKNKVGIFGRQVKLDTVLREGDRVEIYRPMKADPKQVRRLRAAKGQERKKL